MPRNGQSATLHLLIVAPVRVSCTDHLCFCSGFIKAFNASSAGNHDLDAPDAQKKGRGMRLIGRRSKTLEK